MPTFGSALWGGVAGNVPVPTGVPVKNLFYMALRLAHVTKAAQIGPSPDQLADCLQQAQLMIDQASVRRPMVYSILLTTYVLGTGKVYTLGPGGMLVSTAGASVRPVKIERARLVLNSTGTAVHLGIHDGTYEEFAHLAVQDIPGALPKLLYCDYAYPLANVYLIPQDQGGDQLELYTWQSLPNLVTVSDLISLAPGYQDWFVNNLAVRLASVFAEQGASVSDDTRLEARLSTRALQTRNVQSPRMSSDVPSHSRSGGGGSFNYLSGTDK